MSDKKGLTPKQIKILQEIQGFTKANGYPPSYEELKQLMNLKSKSNIHRYIHVLKKRGYLDFLPAQGRSLHLL
jgi:repressor LexA|tara:strand:- start:38 stop:256 length:219 start_codon:yes stop_codon:yes gene_type:complete